MVKRYVLLASCFLAAAAFAQVEDESCQPPSKKTQKYLDAALNANDARTAVDNFNKAIDEEPDLAAVYFEYGVYAFETGQHYYETNPDPSLGDRSFQKALEMFRKSIELCSDYHASAFYYAGVVLYSQNEKEQAMPYFKKFRDYKNPDVEKYPEDYDKKLADVKQVLSDFEANQELMAEEVPFNPAKVKNVSTKNDEYFPMISPDNELMFYTRRLDRRNLGDMVSNVVEEFTYSERPDAFSDFDGGHPFKAPFNDGTFGNYGAATISVDNKEMILCACKTENVMGQQYNNCDLYITTFERSGEGGNDFVWSELKNMGPGINTNNGWEGQPSLSADGNTLFYATSRPGSRDNDIYIVERDENGKWGNARPFDEINTDGKDKSPFLHQDSETLYFVSSVSDKRRGAGGLDIFYSRFEDGQWTKPKNIGVPINTTEDELGLFVSADGKLAYYSSRFGGDWNIYAFELYEEARPKPVVIVKGELKDDNGQPVKDATIEIAYANTDEVTQVRVNGDDGKYAAVVRTDDKQDVMVTVKKEGHAFDSKLITKEQLAQSENKVSIRQNDLDVKELKVGNSYTINDILYATNSAELNAHSKFILKQFARFLRENPNVRIAIQGHTDDVGDDARNLQLSEERAQGVKAYLVSLGIAANRLEAKGYGETQPKVPNTSEQNRAQNRRTDFEIVGL